MTIMAEYRSKHDGLNFIVAGGELSFLIIYSVVDSLIFVIYKFYAVNLNHELK